jgi:hypothetical protein
MTREEYEEQLAFKDAQQDFIRSHSGEGRYINYCVWIECGVLLKAVSTVNEQFNKIYELPMMEIKPYMTDEEVMKELSQYDEHGFEDLPSWLKDEIRARNLPIPARSPSDLEQWETVSDALEHRITNNELTVNDYINKYKHGKDIEHVF